MWTLILLAVVAACAVQMVWCRRSWNVKGQHVLVTGGSQGLGLALAKLLAQRGAHVVICSRSEAKLKTALADVEKCRSFEEQQLDYVVGDVSTFDGAAKAVAQCPFVASAVFCCAGGAKPGFFLDQNEADFQQGMKLDYWTALATAHAAAASMKQHGVHGKIVFVSSVLGFMGMVGYAQYSPMKYAIRGLAECLRMELQMHGIQVHSYFPATILSPGFEEENKTKPSLTKEIEGTDEGQTPEQCAAHLLRGIEQNYFNVTDCLIGSFMRIASGGCAPGQGWLADSLLLLPARWALVAWRRFVADRAVQKVSVSSVY
ncbi:Similar to S.cerevisiae protein TSC10 (3-ketosphinganine reductase) [Malassezia sympodialis ATCC 42132]|uniref:3-dehydrosphinganine reductase n=1 Tax=Malassezia sympodialis (strain ATCC 42132) TaxID=1230383 RepID=A0A1M8A2C8_MALS4|nr:Similar to S.cerevisiae protein TSC10 (3-ketosphinganine reductase) [Malassezia sympodialis ATCC 42132]